MKEQVCCAKTKAGLLTRLRRQKMDEKKIAFAFPNLFLSHSHQRKSLMQEKYINFYLIAEDTCKTVSEVKLRGNFCQSS